MNRWQVLHTQNRVLTDIKTMTHEQLQEQYDIEIDDIGNVYDNIEGKKFDTLILWAAYQVEQEQLETECFEKIRGKTHYDDGTF